MGMVNFEIPIIEKTAEGKSSDKEKPTDEL